MHPNPIRPTLPSPAFTLLELLIVVTVLGLIAGTLGATSVRATLRGKTVGCLAHLRQWGAATFLHTSDHNDELPYDGAPNGISTQDAWYVDLPKALGIRTYPEEGDWRTNARAVLPRSIWICPANNRKSNGRMLFHYSLNRRVNGSGEAARQTRLTSIPEPSTLVWLFENGKLAAVAAEGNAHTNAHSGSAHFLFLDGHVQRHPVREFWDFTRRRALTNGAALRWYP